MSELKINTISVHELKKRHDLNNTLCLIDVREDNEWKEAHILWAKHIPKDKISDDIKTLVTDLSSPIYLHCRGGVRSLDAASKLIALGYKEVYSVDGGINEWANSGYPIVV